MHAEAFIKGKAAKVYELLCVIYFHYYYLVFPYWAQLSSFSLHLRALTFSTCVSFPLTCASLFLPLLFNMRCAPFPVCFIWSWPPCVFLLRTLSSEYTLTTFDSVASSGLQSKHIWGSEITPQVLSTSGVIIRQRCPNFYPTTFLLVGFQSFFHQSDSSWIQWNELKENFKQCDSVIVLKTGRIGTASVVWK